MSSNLSALSLLAVSLYSLVALTALAAAGSALGHRQAGWHVRIWILIGALFVALAVLRGFGLEDLWQNELRSSLRAEGAYKDRRDFQRPLAAGVVALAGMWAFFLAYRGFSRVRGRRNVAAMIAVASAFIMTALVALRLISLHPVDALLYGPIKLNWIIDIGSSLVVLGAAGYYFNVVRQRP
jgi:hypothetical protein